MAYFIGTSGETITAEETRSDEPPGAAGSGQPARRAQDPAVPCQRSTLRSAFGRPEFRMHIGEQLLAGEPILSMASKQI